jgi:outer membrane lipoprotein LolB
MRLFVALLFTSLLSACAQRPLAPVTDPAHMTHWRAEGKLGLRVADRGGNLYFTWQQENAHYTLTLSGPLGAGRTELSGGPEGVVLRNGELGDIPASSPEILLEAVTGYRAPVSYLAHWLKAQPATLEARIQREADGRPHHITEDGWTATFMAWDATHPALPQKIVVTGPDTRLTVVISQWQPMASGHPAQPPSTTVTTPAPCCN